MVRGVHDLVVDMFFFSGRSLHTRCALVTGVQTCALPISLLIAGLMNHVFEKPYAPLVTLSIPAGLARGTMLPIRLHTDYLVCTDQICVPEAADLATILTIGDGAIDPGVRARFDGWRQAIPKPIGSPATYQIADGRVRKIGRAHV